MIIFTHDVRSNVGIHVDDGIAKYPHQGNQYKELETDLVPQRAVTPEFLLIVYCEYKSSGKAIDALR
jgi:hypothetical protein